jgi:hypothetical protein
MSVNSCIVIDDANCKVYKHWNGYPEEMMGWLVDFHGDFLKSRGYDPEYELAQLLRFAAINAEKYNLDPSMYTGWGVYSKDTEICVDYTYILERGGKVTCLDHKVNIIEERIAYGIKKRDS